MARALIRSALKDQTRTTYTDIAELLTAELVTNAVEHTNGDDPIELVVERDTTGFQVKVYDRDPAPPGNLSDPGDDCPPDVWQEGGRGLLLIRALSLTCGHRVTKGGKVVWFTLALAACH
jgi:anti-sigma regulatory factor (Ser/Thr protein kinase)